VFYVDSACFQSSFARCLSVPLKVGIAAMVCVLLLCYAMLLVLPILTDPALLIVLLCLLVSALLTWHLSQKPTFLANNLLHSARALKLITFGSVVFLALSASALGTCHLMDLEMFGERHRGWLTHTDAPWPRARDSSPSDGAPYAAADSDVQHEKKKRAKLREILDSNRQPQQPDKDDDDTDDDTDSEEDSDKLHKQRGKTRHRSTPPPGATAAPVGSSADSIEAFLDSFSAAVAQHANANAAALADAINHAPIVVSHEASEPDSPTTPTAAAGVSPALPPSGTVASDNFAGPASASFDATSAPLPMSAAPSASGSWRLSHPKRRRTQLPQPPPASSP
jgi:hypothetical protein